MRRTVAALIALLLPAVAAAQPSPTFTTLHVTGASTLSGGGTLTGTFTGGTFSGITLSGTIAGTPTFSGALTFNGALTNASTLAQQGNITAGTGSATWRITSGTTGNWVWALTGASSVFTITSGNTGAPGLLQFSSSANQVTSKYQFIVQAQNGTTPIWTAGALMNAMTPIYSSLVWTGTATSAGASATLGRYYDITSQVTTNSPTTGVAVDFVKLTLNSANVTGNAHVLDTTLNITATTGNLLANGGSVYVGHNLNVQASINDNGTGLTPTTAHGALFAINPVAELLTGATNWSGVIATEFNVGVQTGATVMNKGGIAITTLIDDAVHGALDDYGLKFSSTGGVGWNALIAVGAYGGLNPMDPINGWVLTFAPHLGVGTQAGAGGLDFTNFVPTTAFMRGNNFLLDPSGNWTANSYKVGSNQVVGARITGWGAATNGAKTAFNGSTATLAQTSAAVAQVIADLTTHGLIGP